MKTVLAAVIPFGILAVVLSLMGFAAVKYIPGDPGTDPVTAVQLLDYRGFDYQEGNPVVSMRLIVGSDLHGLGIGVLGTGAISISTSQKAVLLVGIQSASGIHFYYLNSWTAKIEPGPASIHYELATPYKSIYDRAKNRGITNDHLDRDDAGYHKMSPNQLLDSNLVQDRVLTMDQATFTEVFGGTN